MNKKVLAIVLIIVLIIGIIAAAVICKNVSGEKTDNASVSDEAEETTLPPELRMLYPDRLCGTPETDYEAKDNTIVVSYGESGTLKRVFGSDELLQPQQDYSEEATKEMSGNTVTLKGKNGMIYTAAWVENYNSYLIELNPTGEGIDENEMAEYVASAE